MGKFINKQYTDVVDSLTSSTNDKIKNANYLFNNKNPVVCGEWLNINKDATTIDEGSGIAYSEVGKSSPIRYNAIRDAVFYAQGIQISLDMEYDEDGVSLQSNAISGIILPNTWIPYQGDFFWLKQAGKDYLYRVTSIGYDTIENGNNVYSFEASISQTDAYDTIEKQIVKRYNMVMSNVGTSFNAIIEEDVYNSIVTLDDLLITLKNNYIAMFYNDAVQTFTYETAQGKLYDPYMIEFLIRNNILDGSDEYIYVHHEIEVPRTFAIDYNSTLFRALETKNPNKFSVSICTATGIDNQYSLFSTVYDTYYMISYNEEVGIIKFFPINSELISNVKSGEEFDIYNDKSYMNSIIRYMNNKENTEDLASVFENLDFKPTPDMFYAIPMIIHALESNIKTMMS